jgi:hypothetical protein
VKVETVDGGESPYIKAQIQRGQILRQQIMKNIMSRSTERNGLEPSEVL